MSAAALGARVALASAGTGKTFALSNRLLALLHAMREGEGDPSSILATTFTRAAAGEIRSRLFERLLEARADEGRRRLLEETAGLPSLDTEALEDWLAWLVRKSEDIQVRTLDSWFAGLAAVFGPELGLPPGWRLVDEAEAAFLEEEAVTRVLEEAGAEALAPLVRALVRGKAGHSPRHGILKAVRKAHALWVQTPGLEAWSHPGLVPPKPDRSLEDLLESLTQAEVPRTKNNTPDKRWTKGLQQVVERVQSGDWESLMKTGLAQAIATQGSYYGDEAPEALARDLRDAHAFACHHLLTDLVRRGEALGRLLEHYDRARTALQTERGLFGFDDLPRRLAAHERLRRPEERSFRSGETVRHLLLDEFQDTSLLQWAVLEPLARPLLESERDDAFFCVGDPKQAIYAWRQGEAGILRSLAEAARARGNGDGSGLLELNATFRNGTRILDFVNHLFREALPAWTELEAEDRAPLQAKARDFAAAFPVHERHPAAPPLEGRFELLRFGGKEDSEAEDAASARREVLELAAERVARRHQEDPGRTIGVLFRRRKDMPRFLRLLQERGVEASAEGSQEIGDSPAVLAILSLLHHLAHPADTAAWFHWAVSPPGVAAGLDPRTPPDAEGLRRQRRELLRQGLAAWIAARRREWEETGKADAWDRMRLDQLQELAAASPEEPLDPGAFVERVRRLRLPNPAASAVRVLTVHGSKGLEFDTVVLPDLDSAWDEDQAEYLVEREDPLSPRIQRVLPRPRKELLQHLPAEIQGLEAARRQDAFEENLCVFYVACTRAREELLLVIARPYSRRRGFSPARLLEAALPGVFPPGAGDPPEVLAAAGSLRPPGEAEAPAPVPEEEVPGPEAWQPPRRPRLRPRRTPSGAEGGPRPAAEWMGMAAGAGAETARRRGLLLHRWCEEIAWLEDYVLDAEALFALAAARGLDQGLDLQACFQDFQTMLESPEIRAALLRSSWPEGSELHRERAFAVLLEEEEGGEILLRGAFDRLILLPGGAGAVIQDFKTDRFGGEDALEERRAWYEPQMKAYRRAAARQWDLPLERVRAELLFLEAGRRLDAG